MRSNICKIENGIKDLAAILKESEKVAVYNELTHKQTLQLRLICEEIDGMLPNIIDDFSGDFWIDFEDGVCRVNVSLQFDEFTPEKKEGLVDIAKNKTNAAAVGIVGKIRSTLEDVFLVGDSLGRDGYLATEYFNYTDHYSGIDFPCVWSLEQYKNNIKKDDAKAAWDELEKSVLASVADDVIIGVKGKRADIIIVKKFA